MRPTVFESAQANMLFELRTTVETGAHTRVGAGDLMRR
jgi:hypothetical protein